MKIHLLSDLHNEFLRSGEDHPDHHWLGSIPDTDSDIIVLAGDIDIWAFGHTHANLDEVLFDTRIVSNQAGYPGERVSAFNAEFIIEI